jgi:Uncharacterized protein conserved in bacteria (DUF2188)
MADEVHVVPAKNGWEVREAGTYEPVSAHASPEDAVIAARQLARESGADVVVHAADGSVRAREEPGQEGPAVAPPTDTPG